MEALEAIQPDFIRRPAGGARRLAAGGLATAAVLLAAVGVLFASTAPDGIERLGAETGIAGRARTLLATPLGGYEMAFLGSSWLSKAAAGLAGLALIWAACRLLAGVAIRRKRRA